MEIAFSKVKAVRRSQKVASLAGLLEAMLRIRIFRRIFPGNPFVQFAITQMMQPFDLNMLYMNYIASHGSPSCISFRYGLCVEEIPVSPTSPNCRQFR